MANAGPRLHAATSEDVYYVAVDANDEALSGYPLRVSASVVRDETTRTYADDGDSIIESYRFVLLNSQVTPSIGDYITYNSSDYGIVSIDEIGHALTTVTAQRIYSARVGARQAHQR